MINTLPYQEKKMVHRIRSLRIMVVTMWMLIILMIIGMLLFFPTLITINSRYNIAANQIAELEKNGDINTADVSALQKRIQDLSTKLAGTLPVPPTEHVAIIQATATKGISLSGFSVSDTKQPILNVSGIAKTRESLQTFIDTLKAHEAVGAVDSPVSNFVKNVDSQFIITVTFKK